MTLLWDSWEDQTFPWNPECFGQCFPGPQRDCHPDGRGRPRGKPSPGRRGRRALSLHCPLRDACRALGDGDSASLWRKSDRVSPSTKDTGFLSGHAARARRGFCFRPSAWPRGPGGCSTRCRHAHTPAVCLSASGFAFTPEPPAQRPCLLLELPTHPGEPDAPALNLCVYILT